MAISIVIVLSACCGCRNKASPVPSGPWLVVSSDVKELDAARKRSATAESDAYESLMKSATKSLSYLDSETMELVERHHDDAIARLEKMITSAKGVDETAGASLLLCRLKIAAGRQSAAKVLRAGSAAARTQILHTIDGGLVAIYENEEDSYRQFILGDPDLVAALLIQLDDADPKVVDAAVQSCGILKVPGALERFLKLLDDPKIADPGRLLYWLSKGPLTQELLDKARRHIQPATVKKSSDLSVFEAFALHSDPQFRLAGREELKKWLAATPGDDTIGYGGDRLGVLSVLAKTSTEQDLDWLQQTIPKERGLYGQHLLSALIRLQGAEGKQHLLQLLADPAQHTTAIAVASEVFAGTSDAEIVNALCNASGNSKELESICSALLSIGGDTAKVHVRKVISRLDGNDQERFLRQLDQPPLNVIEQRLIESGLLDAKTAKLAFAQLAKVDQSERTESPGLLEVLTAAGLVVGFDAETGMLPCQHDQLVGQFSKQSRNIFNPTAASEEWHQRTPDDYEAEYTLRFIYDGKLYQGRLRNLGDWYDVERTVTMINRALKDAQHQEEFIGVGSGDQIATFIFAKRKILEPLAAEFHLPLSKDMNEAMRAGKGFEQKVFDSLRNNDKSKDVIIERNPR